MVHNRARIGMGADVHFVYLRADHALCAVRLAARPSHFFDPVLLSNQFASLEEPGDAFKLDATFPSAKPVMEIRRRLAGRLG